MQYPELTKEFLIINLIDQNKSLALLSEEVGCCKLTIIKRCKQYGIYKKVKDRKYKKCLQNKDNLVNKVFGNLTVLELGVSDSHGKRRWLCKCSCGKTKLIHASSLKRNLSKSCGYCLMSRPGFTGYKTISGSWLRRLKDSADKRGVNFEITSEEIYALWLRQNKKCALSGVDVFFCTNQDRSTQTASVDRIDNSLGYILSNIQIVHKRINRLKTILDNDEFIFWCHRVAKNTKLTKKYDVEKIKWTDGQRSLSKKLN